MYVITSVIITIQKQIIVHLCRTRWVERINALEVALDLLEVIIDTFSGNTEKNWNRDTVIRASSLLKRIDFEFIINLMLIQKVIVKPGMHWPAKGVHLVS